MAADPNPHPASDVHVAAQEPVSRRGGGATAADTPPLWRRHWKLLLVCAAAVILVSGVLLEAYFAGYETTDDAQIDAHLYAVSARIPGCVTNVPVNDNQYVRQGDVLVELDPADYRLVVERARAELASAEATAQSLSVTVPITAATTSSQLASSAADVESAAANILAAEQQAAAAYAQLQAAEANDARVQGDLKRYQLLVEKQEISAQMYAQSLAAVRASTANVAAARANAAAADQAIRQATERRAQAGAARRTARAELQQVGSTQARALAAEADVRQKRAALAQAELNLGYTRILAPASGQVRKNVVVGVNFQPGQQLLTIVPLEDVWVTANFKETQLRQIRPGQRVDISVDSNGRTYRGYVDTIGAATGPVFSLLPPENATGNYVKVVQRIPVKIILEPGENRDRQLRPGMSVVPRVYLR
jgi:membrane fusion protein, multidrug efflux system